MNFSCQCCSIAAQRQMRPLELPPLNSRVARYVLNVLCLTLHLASAVRTDIVIGEDLAQLLFVRIEISRCPFLFNVG